jgi:hypothetical protein
MRDSLSGAVAPSETVNCGGERVSDYQAVDDAKSFWSGVLTLLWRVLWVIMIMIGLAAFCFPYLFPRWSEDYRKELDELTIAANTGGFFKNAVRIDWKEAFNEANLESLLLVGTGRHAEFKTDKSLRNYWYTGDGVFIMKTYVTELEFKRYADNVHTLPDGEIIFPITNVDHDEASEYCQAQGGRLPSMTEIIKSLHFADIKNMQGDAGDFLRPNLVFEVHPEIDLWTSTPKDDTFFSGDNYLIVQVGKKNYIDEDNGYSGDSLGFLCAKDAIDKAVK